MALRAPAPLARWLAEKSPGERRAIAATVVLAGLALLWAALWQPLVRDTATMRADRPGNAAALAGARQMSAEIAGLARTSAAPAPTDMRAGLERILVQHNLRGAVTQLDWQEGRARIVFAAIGYDALIVALEALQRESQLRAIDAVLTARVEPGVVRAELTLTR